MKIKDSVAVIVSVFLVIVANYLISVLFKTPLSDLIVTTIFTVPLYFTILYIYIWAYLQPHKIFNEVKERYDNMVKKMDMAVKKNNTTTKIYRSGYFKYNRKGSYRNLDFNN